MVVFPGRTCRTGPSRLAGTPLMHVRRCFMIAAVLNFVLGSALRGDEAGDLKQALALQKAMQKAIRDAEPSIACILVSRSDLYQKLGHRPNPEQPGKLG